MYCKKKSPSHLACETDLNLQDGAAAQRLQTRYPEEPTQLQHDNCTPPPTWCAVNLAHATCHNQHATVRAAPFALHQQPAVVNITVRSVVPGCDGIPFRVLKGTRKEMPHIAITTECLEALLAEVHAVLHRSPAEKAVGTPPRRKRLRDASSPAGSAASPGQSAASAASAPKNTAPLVTKAVYWLEERRVYVARVREKGGSVGYRTFVAEGGADQQQDAHAAAKAWAAENHFPAPKRRRLRRKPS